MCVSVHACVSLHVCVSVCTIHVCCGKRLRLGWSGNEVTSVCVSVCVSVCARMHCVNVYYCVSFFFVLTFSSQRLESGMEQW